MIKDSSKQNGSAHVVIISVIIFAILGALGFVFWNNFMKKEAVSTETASKEEEPQAKLFSIKDYEVQFTIPAALSDTTIKYEPRQIGEASFLAFTTQRVIDLGGDCAKGYPFGDIVTLSRDNQAKSDQYQVYTSEKINNYYYHIGTVDTSGLTPKSTCPANAQAKSDEDALVSALKTVVPQD